MFQFDGVNGKLKSIQVRNGKHAEEGWFNDITMSLEVPLVDGSDDLNGMDEKEMVEAMHRKGRVLSKKEGPKTYELKTKRKFPPVETTFVAGKLKVVTLGQFKQYKTHCVEGTMYVTFAVAARVPNELLGKLGRMMDSPVSISTTAKQLDLLKDKGEQAA